ncbi:MAG: hypothetical protein L0Z50_13555 [Verrucomicrobiales bacterium]|nr:hypothetical protein [Verrucomicrobiales bacterium]
MAIWQYDIGLVPRLGVIRLHGIIPAELPGYRAVWNPEEGAEKPLPNYWDDGLPPASLAGEIAAMLPVGSSWSADALMYGAEDSHCVKIWKTDGITFRFDLRRPDLSLLRSIVDFADRHGLLLVPDTRGQPMEPSFEGIIADMRTSDAYRFCKDPEAYLRSLKYRNDAR